MRLGRLLWWVYQLSVLEFVLVFAGATLAFLWLYHRLGQWWGRRAALAVLLLLWVAAVLATTVTNRTVGATDAAYWLPLHSYREMLETGNREILRSNLMNVALFYPAGLLFMAALPKRWGYARRLGLTVLLFGLFSLSIELVQYRYLLGRAEIDDVLHNTLGAVIGCLALSLGSTSTKILPDDL